MHISTMGQFRMLYLGAGLSALVTFLCAFFLVPLAQEIALTLLGAGEFKPAPFIGWWNGGLSLVAGIAACEALRALGHAQVALKWPNDLVVAGSMTDGSKNLRKLGGLLVEGGGEAAGAARAVIGLGINIRMPAAVANDIDQPWIDLASMSQAAPARNAVVAALLSQLLPALQQFDAEGLAPFLPRYAALDALAGRALRVHEAGHAWPATALGIADDGALRVRDGDGRERLVHAGDVSVRA